MPPSLTHLRILLTRPAAQTAHLAAMIADLGGFSLTFPTLEIFPVADTEKLKASLNLVAQYPIAIFVSANAVNFALQYGHEFLHDSRVIAIGPGTARALSLFQVAVTTVPAEHHSEGILALPQLQKITGQKIAIFCGESSRSVLADGLKARGAQVKTVICYRSRCPQADTQSALARWRQAAVNVIVSTSQASLANLYELFAKIGGDWLLVTPLLVISPTMAAFAQRLGFQSIIVAAGASDEAICAALVSVANSTMLGIPR